MKRSRNQQNRTERFLWALAVLTLSFASPAATAAPADPTDAYDGHLQISEVMVNPLGANDLGREWVELFNAGDTPIALPDVRLTVSYDKGLRTYGLDVAEDALLLPGLYLVIGPPGLVSGAVAPFEEARALLGSFFLPNTRSTIQLLVADDVVDEMAYGTAGIDVPVGASLNREPYWSYAEERPPSLPAGLEIRWCASRSLWNADGELATPGGANTWCDDDGDGFAEDQDDCDDTRDSVSPLSSEVCDGLDNDCDGDTDEPAALSTVVTCLSAGLCADVTPECQGEDGWLCAYPEGYEDDEVSCDGRDNDCDGQTDEGLLNRCGKCGALPADICDGVDNDCDGETDEAATAGPSRTVACLTEGVCAGATARCAGAEGWLCAYGADYEPGDEVSCDARDNDCDGETDEGFRIGEPCTAGQGACAVEGLLACSPDSVGSRCDAPPLTPSDERCGDGVDNDCDGETDEGFSIGDDCSVGEGACRALGKTVCSVDGTRTVCSAEGGTPNRERCGDGTDNDCDGETDETACVDDEEPTAELPVGCSAGPRSARSLLPLLLLWGLVGAWIQARRSRDGRGRA